MKRAVTGFTDQGITRQSQMHANEKNKTAGC